MELDHGLSLFAFIGGFRRSQIVAGSSKSRHPARKTDNSLRMNIYPPRNFILQKVVSYMINYNKKFDKNGSVSYLRRRLVTGSKN
mgnify:CR=1 FL=1